MKTERLFLRPFQETDFADVLAIARDKMASPYAPYDNAWPTGEAGVRSILAHIMNDDVWYAVELIAERRVIGFIVATRTEDEKTRDIGYTMHRAYQNHGYAYEACRAVMRDCMENRGIEGFTAGTADCNAPSIRLLQKLGFVRVKAVQGIHFTTDAAGDPIVFDGSDYVWEGVFPDL